MEAGVSEKKRAQDRARALWADYKHEALRETALTEGALSCGAKLLEENRLRPDGSAEFVEVTGDFRAEKRTKKGVTVGGRCGSVTRSRRDGHRRSK